MKIERLSSIPGSGKNFWWRNDANITNSLIFKYQKIVTCLVLLLKANWWYWHWAAPILFDITSKLRCHMVNVSNPASIKKTNPITLLSAHNPIILLPKAPSMQPTPTQDEKKNLFSAELISIRACLRASPSTFAHHTRFHLFALISRKKRQTFWTATGQRIQLKIKRYENFPIKKKEILIKSMVNWPTIIIIVWT